MLLTMLNANYAVLECNIKEDALLKALRVYLPILRHTLHTLLPTLAVIIIVYKCKIENQTDINIKRKRKQNYDVIYASLSLIGACFSLRSLRQGATNISPVTTRCIVLRLTTIQRRTTMREMICVFC